MEFPTDARESTADAASARLAARGSSAGACMRRTQRTGSAEIANDAMVATIGPMLLPKNTTAKAESRKGRWRRPTLSSERCDRASRFRDLLRLGGDCAYLERESSMAGARRCPHLQEGNCRSRSRLGQWNVDVQGSSLEISLNSLILWVMRCSIRATRLSPRTRAEASPMPIVPNPIGYPDTSRCRCPVLKIGCLMRKRGVIRRQIRLGHTNGPLVSRLTQCFRQTKNIVELMRTVARARSSTNTRLRKWDRDRTDSIPNL